MLKARYNYGVGYIASLLKKNGYAIDYITLENKEDILGLYKKIELKRPKIIAFSATTSQFTYLKDITKKIRGISNAFIVCGGMHPTLKPECIYEIPDLNAIVRGEGEFPMVELAKTLESKENYLKIRNFWFKKEKEIIKNELRPLIGDLDELPFPDKDPLDYQQAIDKNGGTNRFIFSRGCIFECPYCSNKALAELYKDKGTYFRIRSPEKAIDEIKLDASKYKFDKIFFDDDIISLDKKWFYQFFNLYRKQFKYPFMCNVRPGLIDSDMIKLLKKAGCGGVSIGIEHGNEEFRKTVLKRNITNKQIIDIYKLFNKYNITFNSGQIMVGLPFENKELFFSTVKLCRKLPLSYYSIYIFFPYPGTEFGKLCEKNDWLPKKKYFIERTKATISYPNFTKDEIQSCHDIFPFLMRFKCIPLSMPLKWQWICVRCLSRFCELIAILKRRWKRNKKR